MVAYPSPPEICWHLIAPFTFALGTKYPLVPIESVVGPAYAGSELLSWSADGWVMVLVGHCTRNDCAFATAARHIRRIGNHTWDDLFMAFAASFETTGATKAPFVFTAGRRHSLLW